MIKSTRSVALVLALVAILLASPSLVSSQGGPVSMDYCREVAFSTEEDFLAQFAAAPGVVSDGDLLGANCGICARNADLLLETFDVGEDLGLDAADVIDVEIPLVAFSTELDSPNNAPGLIQFMAGDLLVTNRVVIPNQALTVFWFPQERRYDLGLDAVHFVGELGKIKEFLAEAQLISRDEWLRNLELLPSMLEGFGIDIWYSTEGTLGPVEAPTFLDGDLLSVLSGMVASNDVLLPVAVPAGIPQRGVDFGLDAATTDRLGNKENIHFSTEILYDGRISFTDGDVLRYDNGVRATNWDLIHCFDPKARELGLDALSVNLPAETPCVSRITKIGGVDIADISMSDGMVMSGTLGIPAPLPFGGRIDIQGSLCNDVDRFRVVYRKAGTADPWEPMKVLESKNWRVRVDGFFPPGPDCESWQKWFSDADGWFDGNDYRHLTEPGLGGCNYGLSLTVWESATTGADDLYEVRLEADTTSGPVIDTERLVQLDNTPPVVELKKTPGECDDLTSADMPLTVEGRMLDDYFYKYQLRITGDSYPIHSYPEIAYYDDPGDNVVDTGTVSWPAYVELHDVTVYDLDAKPVECGYTVLLTGWDRTVVCGFIYPANHIARCIGCRHANDAWSFKFTP